jgi:hypothetical protein
VGSRLGFDCLQWLSGLGMLWTFRFSVVGFRLSVVSCGFSVGIRLLTVAFWVGDDVDFSVFGCGFSVVCCELWVLGWDSIAYSGFLGWG